MKSNIVKLNSYQQGATMIEYAVLVALIAIAVIATVVLLGQQIDATFTQIVSCLQDPDSAACTGG